MFGEGVGYTVTGYKARPLRLPSRLLHAAWSLIELGLQPRHSLAHAFDQAAIHDATGHERTHHRAALQGKKHKARAMEQWNSQQRQHARRDRRKRMEHR
jgi:hypothetical protein